MNGAEGWILQESGRDRTTESEAESRDALIGPQWYVVQAKPYQEGRLTFKLMQRVPSLEVFLPLIEVPRGRRHRRWNSLEPLFPGYLFARIPPEALVWNAVRWTPGAKRILGCGDVPVPVPPEFISEIRARVAEHGYLRPGIRFRPGARVRLRDGPFAGLEGIFERQLSRAGRVRVLLNLLSRTTPIDVDVLELEPC